MIENTSHVTRSVGGALRIGEMAPNFMARSTTGEISFSDYRGGWVVLVSHPGDFTPVCTSEFITLAKRLGEFEARDCAVIALSVDSLFSHLAWVRSIYEKTGIKITFPIIEDPTLTIANAYGMVGGNSQDAATVRATFFIDPSGLIRASTYYPATVGRSVDEMLRILSALQKTDAENILIPEGWSEGADVLIPPQQSINDIFEHDPGEWFYQYKQSNKG